MPDYKFYNIRIDGHVIGPPDVVACESDPVAIKKARDLVRDGDIEIWQGARLIAYLTPEDRPQAG